MAGNQHRNNYPFVTHRDSVSQRQNVGKEMDKAIYDAQYWFKKADILVKEKKKHLDETAKFRQQFKEAEDRNKEMKERIKHLEKVIEKFKLKDDEQIPLQESKDTKLNFFRMNSGRINESFLEIQPTPKLPLQVLLKPRQRGFLPMLFSREIKEEE